MGLKSKTVILKWDGRPKNYTHYKNLGYVFNGIKDKFKVKVEDLTDSSNAKVEVQCDGCDKLLENIEWYNYKKYVKKDGKYYCHTCSMRIYGAENVRISKLQNGKSFEQWCVENSRQDILDRWEYEKNIKRPKEISYASQTKHWFKCPRKIHNSELKKIGSFTSGLSNISCNQCNSFAQWNTDNLDKDFLEKYWDYKLNNVDPWEISHGSGKEKVWIICQENNYHKSYSVPPLSFINGSRCPECNQSKGEKRIDSVLINNNWIKVSQKEFDKSVDKNKYNKKYFITQKTFKGLVGMGNRLLSYDHFLIKLNLLIEFQGMQHEKYIPGFHKSKKDFERQVEHDKRKKEYAKNNGINFLEIWYYDFNNIEEILKGFT